MADKIEIANANKTFYSRFQMKYDTYENWTTANPVLLAGEMAIATIAAADGATSLDHNSVPLPQVLIKIGDGTSTYTALPFVSAKAADVYEWAKAATKPSYEVGELTDAESIKVYRINRFENERGPCYRLQERSVTSTSDDDWKDVVYSVDETLGKANYIDIPDLTADLGAVINKLGNLPVENGETKFETFEAWITAVEAKADANAEKIGEIPEESGATTLVEYINKKTEGIATDAALNELQKAVEDLNTEVGDAAEGENAASGLYKVIEDAVKAETDRATGVEGGLADRIKAVEDVEFAGENAIVVTEANSKVTTKLVLDETTTPSEGKTAVTLVQSENGLRAEVTIPDAPVQNVSGDAKIITVTPTDGDYKVSATLGLKYVAATADTNAKIALTGIDGTVLTNAQGEEIAIDASDFVKDGMLESVTYSDEENTITFTWNTDAGKQATTVDLDDILEAYTAGDGIDITEHKISVKLDATTETFLTVGADGLKLAGVQNAINTAKQEAIDAVVGTEADEATANTVYGAKAYADSLTTDIADLTQNKGYVVFCAGSATEVI